MFRSPGPIALHVGPFTLRWYGLLMATAMALGLWLAHRDARRRGIDAEDLLKAAELALLGGLVGARLYYVAFNLDYYSAVPAEDLRGLGGRPRHPRRGPGRHARRAAATRGCRRLPVRTYLDIAAPSLALGQAIGRWGNFFNEEAFGTPTDLPWKLFISPSQRPLEYAQAEFFHPTFLYESLWDAVVFALLVWVFRERFERAPGALFLVYLGLYSMGRFLTEALRTDALMLGSIRVAQLVSLLGVAAALRRRALADAARQAAGGGAEPRRVMTRYESRDGRIRLFRGDSRRLAPIAASSVGVIVTSPPYWISGRGRASAERYARQLAVDFGREWRRVLALGRRPLARDRRPARRHRMGGAGRRRDGLAPPHGLAASVEGLLGADALARALGQPRELPAALPEGHGAPVRPRGTTLCFMLPLPRSHPDSLWDAIPEPVVRGDPRGEPQARARARPVRGRRHGGPRRGALGREWIGVERDPHMAGFAARRLRLRPVRRAGASAYVPASSGGAARLRRTRGLTVGGVPRS